MDAQSDDAAEILALIHAHRIAFWMQDFDAYARCFVQAPYTTRWNASRAHGINVRRGWDAIAQRVQGHFADPDLLRPALAHETKVVNLHISAGADVAWATYDQIYPSHVRGEVGPPIMHEARVFERHDGRWRIAFLGYLDDNANSLLAGIRLAPDGAVLWMSPDAAVALESDDDLVIRNGRLRLRDGRADQKLQAAIRWASGLDVGVLLGRGALPIVLESGEGLPTKLWWVIAESGMILFSMGGSGLSEQRLAAAAVVYGLSDAQRRLCALIAEGRTLKEIATAMHITPNTARTHLNRVFEKTGVRTQTSLVRVLLSSAAPL